MRLKNHLVAAATFATLALPQAHAVTGEAIYKGACIACHGSGVLGAPRIGDKQAWGKLIPEGQTVLTAHGYVGIRGMPPRGGQADLSIEGFASALVFLVNQSGGKWKEPGAKETRAIRLEIARREKELAQKSGK